MNERTVPRNDDHKLEFVSGSELDSYLDSIVASIGWVVVYFNSLEDHVSDFVRQAVLRDPFNDERLDVFLCEMGFSGKCRALVHLYGQMIETGGVKFTHKNLIELEEMLLECASRRNEYAHADWIGARKENYVRIKSQSKRTGVVHRYRKFDLARLSADVNFINDARFTLNAFNEQIHDQLWGRE